MHFVLSVLSFGALAGMVGPPGDVDQDGDSDLFDIAWFQRCFTGPADTPGFEPPSDPVLCFGIFDLAGDGDVDLNDFLLLRPPTVFESYDQVSVPGRPWDVAAGDVDNDGDIDVVTANAQSHDVSVLINTGHGQFAPPVPNLISGCDSFGVVLHDIDGDESLDIIVACYVLNKIAILHGNGDGSFTHTGSYLLPSQPYNLAIGDIDGDSDSDIASLFTGSVSGVVHMLRNLGNGTFNSAGTIQIGDPGADLELADLDTDGDLDLAVTGGLYGGLRVFENEGDWVFTQANAYPVFHYPSSIQIADFDGDENPDITLTNLSPHSNVLVFRNAGSLMFEEIGAYPVGHTPYSHIMDDIDSDGDRDIATVNHQSSTVTILLNDGSGLFDSVLHYACGPESNQLAGADFDADGNFDIVTSNTYNNSVSVLFGEAGPSFRAPRAYDSELYHSSVTTSDMNSDGIIDLVAVGGPYYFPALGVLTVHLGQPNGSFTAPSTYQVFGYISLFVVTADMNGDGDSDVVAASNSSEASCAGTLSVFENDGTGTLVPVVYYSPTGGCMTGLALADLNDEGTPDILVCDAEDDEIELWWYHGTGGLILAAQYAVDDQPSSLATGDIDGDGDIDVVATSYGSDSLNILINDQGTLTQPFEQAPTGACPTFVALGDLNGDGAPDAVTSDSEDRAISLLLNNGAGSFGPRLSIPLQATPRQIGIADVDMDGDADIVITAGEPNVVFEVLQGAYGEFLVADSHFVGGAPRGLAIADLDADGDVDAAMGDSAVLKVLENRRIP